MFRHIGQGYGQVCVVNAAGTRALMAQPEHGKRDDRSLIGVYESEEVAKQAAEAAKKAGAPDGDVRIGARDDEVLSMQAEMQEETDQGWVSPQAGFAYTKESAKGLAILMPLLSLAGAVLALPLAFVVFGGLDLWLRLVIVALVGAMAGATVGLIAGPALGSKDTSVPVAAERGAVLRVDGASPDISRRMADSEPIRLDEVSSSDGNRVTTVTTEEDRSSDGAPEQMARNLNAEDR